ncbi:MAG: hypothetical protein OHK0012_03220 [Synechococcales cyanobacterium]
MELLYLWRIARSRSVVFTIRLRLEPVTPAIGGTTGIPTLEGTESETTQFTPIKDDGKAG